MRYAYQDDDKYLKLKMKKTSPKSLKSNLSKSNLDQTAIDVEFLLISVIQGVALAALASSAMSPIDNLQFQYWPYIFTTFIFILIFWSGAIIHSLSFISWPLDLYHSFLYFLASFVEVMAINHIANPLMWFAFLLTFQVVAAALYLYDLSMIKAHQPEFQDSTARQKLYQHILSGQVRELKIFIPTSLAFNLVAFFSIYYYPASFLQHSYHLVFICFQGLFGLAFLVNSLRSFQIRSRLITNCV